MNKQDECNGWSQFIKWSGSDYFGKGPITPPCDKEDNVPITDSKYSTEHVRADRHGRYVARISCRKKHFHLGVFDSPEEAQSVYISKRKELFGEYCGL
jgi:hypothetical protein